VKLFTLQQNFRCASAICEAANLLIAHNANRVDKKTISATGITGDIDVTCFDDEKDELASILRRIQDMEKWERNDTAILVRTRDLVKFYTEGLETCGIEVRKKRYETVPAEWGAAKRFIALLANPGNDHLAFWWLQRTRGVSEAQKLKLEALRAYQSLNSWVLKVPKEMPIEVLPTALGKAGFDGEIIDRVAAVAATLPEMLNPLPELVLALAKGEMGSGEEGEGVLVTTMHGAKGREAFHVFLPAFEQGTIPNGRSSLDEERRLAFVAVTRTKENLRISYARTRKDFYDFSVKEKTPSQFLREMGLLE
jgi:DNA helicase-2/ATP-dependent DNA helicase PcrA